MFKLIDASISFCVCVFSWSANVFTIVSPGKSFPTFTLNVITILSPLSIEGISYPLANWLTFIVVASDLFDETLIHFVVRLSVLFNSVLPFINVTFSLLILSFKSESLTVALPEILPSFDTVIVYSIISPSYTVLFPFSLFKTLLVFVIFIIASLFFVNVSSSDFSGISFVVIVALFIILSPFSDSSSISLSGTTYVTVIIYVVSASKTSFPSKFSDVAVLIKSFWFVLEPSSFNFSILLIVTLWSSVTFTPVKSTFPKLETLISYVITSSFLSFIVSLFSSVTVVFPTLTEVFSMLLFITCVTGTFSSSLSVTSSLSALAVISAILSIVAVLFIFSTTYSISIIYFSFGSNLYSTPSGKYDNKLFPAVIFASFPVSS